MPFMEFLNLEILKIFACGGLFLLHLNNLLELNPQLSFTVVFVETLLTVLVPWEEFAGFVTYYS